MRALLGGAYRSLEAGADASAIHRLQRGMGGAALGGHALAQQRRGLVRTAGQLCGAGKSSHGQLVRLRLRQTHGAAGAGHGFEEVKHIGRARTRQGGDGVEQWLALHPQEFAGTGHDGFDALALGCAAGGARAYSALMPLPTSAGVLGMVRTTRSQSSHRAMLSDRMPAATLSCSAARTWALACAAASLKVWGLMAQTTIPARCRALPASGCAAMP